MLPATFIHAILYTSLSRGFLTAILGLLPIDQLRSSVVHHCNTILKLTCFNALCLLDLTFLMFKLCQKAFERFSQCLLQDLYTYQRASSLLLLFSEWNSVESRLCKYADIQFTIEAEAIVVNVCVVYQTYLSEILMAILLSEEWLK